MNLHAPQRATVPHNLPQIRQRFNLHLRTHAPANAFQLGLQTLQLESIEPDGLPLFTVSHPRLQRSVQQAYGSHILAAWQQQFPLVTQFELESRVPNAYIGNPQPQLRPPPTPFQPLAPNTPLDPDRLLPFSQLLGPLAQIKRIQHVAAVFYQTSAAHIRGPSQKSKVTYYRHIAVYLCRQFMKADYSDKRIGKYFNNRDHSSIFHGHQRIQKLLATDPELCDEIAYLKHCILTELPLDQPIIDD